MLNEKKLNGFRNLFNGFIAEDAAETVALLKELTAVAKEANQEAYATAVAARKADRELKKAKRVEAFEAAKAAKEEAKAKLAAAKALIEKKPRAKKAANKKTEKKPAKRRIETPTDVVDSMAEGLVDLPNL